jgi:hypothetical protein
LQVENNAASMNYPDLEAARRHHAALEHLFREHDGGRDPRRAVRQVQALCRAASVAIDDAYCRETLGVVGDYACQMLSDRKHPGAEFLRLQIQQALEAFHSRLSSLEVIRRAGASVASPRYLNAAPHPGECP